MAGHNTPIGADETIDRVPRRPDVTEWKRAARRHQNDWRAARSWPAGERPGRLAAGEKRGQIGSRVDLDYAKQHRTNFLTTAAWDAAEDRIRNRQDRQTLDETRLYSDLLSSMPMCFNLLGPLWADPALASAVAHRWFPDLVPEGAPVKVCFEWSPGRSNPKWLDDRTAFDAALFVDPEGTRTLIGIETKYHEHPVKEPISKRNKKTGEVTHRVLKPRYVEVSREANIADEPTIRSAIWGQEIEQVWRDHLLALVCNQQAEDRWNRVHYALVAPAANPAWQPLVGGYLTVAPNAASTCTYRSIDSMVTAAEDLLPHAAQFRARYLDVEGAPAQPAP